MVEKFERDYKIRTEFELYEGKIKRSDCPELLHSYIINYLLHQGNLVNRVNLFFNMNENVKQFEVYIDDRLSIRFVNPKEENQTG